ncbi:hypothetical protein HDA40_005216 [Hamadaea flava]|uniref:Uncharacterized protein n=1 Tax=Hamadaea flava TaxID=1742688 RepID=A0ABV8M1V7_9ACTN|nr:hypothetical protein [Hamadaea flava]MCP2326709.1 hypothetical protein [Hamadaea flava]
MRSPSLPLRPLTVGELLDAAMEVTRGAGRVLLPVAFGLAVLEQLAMVWIRENFFDGSVFPWIGEIVGPAWLGVALGTGMESAVIALVGVPSARAVAATAVGVPFRARDLLRPRGIGSAALLVLVTFLVTFTLTLLPLGWLPAYPLMGLTVAALVIDGVGPLRAIGRGVKMVLRSGARAAAIRLLGYFAWLLLRLGFGFGAASALDLVGVSGPWATAACFALVNTMAYANLASLDAVLHLETRIRTEGLDIALTRLPGALTPGHLVVSR